MSQTLRRTLHRSGAVLVVFALVVALGPYRWATGVAADARDEARSLQEETSVLQGRLSAAEQVNRDQQEYRARVAAVRRALPKHMSPEDLVDEITAVVVKHGLAWESVEIRAPEDIDEDDQGEAAGRLGAGTDVYTFPLEVRGGAEGILGFLDGLVRLDRIVAASQVTLDFAAEGTIAVVVNARTYTWRGPNER